MVHREENASVIVFRGVTVVDGNDGPAKPESTVLVEGGRISAAGSAAQVPVPVGANVVDGEGKFLIPGLWDMHVHTGWQQNFFPLYLAHGITGVRDMGGGLDDPTGTQSLRFDLLNGWRKEIEAGKLLGPRMVMPGAMLDGPKVVWPGSVAVKNADEARQAVAAHKRNGSDFIKVYAKLPRDAYFAIADETKKQGFPYAGHITLEVPAAEASDAGQKSVEHSDGILLACSRCEADVRSEILEIQRGGDQAAVAKATRLAVRRYLDDYDTGKASSLFEKFAKNGTHQVPTLIVRRQFSFIDDSSVLNDSRLRYVPKKIRDIWNPAGDWRFQNRTPEDVAAGKRRLEKEMALVGAMHRAGVPVLAGSDSANPYTFPGSALHEELALLVDAGLSPLRALQAATREAARYLGFLDSLGTIEAGKLADLVLLSADPLADVRNTRQIEAVVTRGKLLARPDLDGLLAFAESAANEGTAS